MRNRQAGISIVALILILALIAIVLIFGMKVIPSFIEYRAARTAIIAIAREKPNATPAEIRKAFDARAIIDSIESVTGAQLEINKGVISFAYRREIPMVTGVAVCIDYTANTATAGAQ